MYITMKPSFLAEIPHEYILMPNIKEKDKPWGIGKAWSLEEAQHQCSKDRYIFLLLLFERYTVCRGGY